MDPDLAAVGENLRALLPGLHRFAAAFFDEIPSGPRTKIRREKWASGIFQTINVYARALEAQRHPGTRRALRDYLALALHRVRVRLEESPRVSASFFGRLDRAWDRVLVANCMAKTQLGLAQCRVRVRKSQREEQEQEAYLDHWRE